MEIKKRYLQENNLVLILIFVESAEHAALKIRKKKENQDEETGESLAQAHETKNSGYLHREYYIEAAAAVDSKSGSPLMYLYILCTEGSLVSQKFVHKKG